MLYLIYLSSSAFFSSSLPPHRIICISQIRNIYSPESDSLHTLHGFLYHKLTVQVKEHRLYHTTLSYTPLYSNFSTNFAIPSNCRMMYPVKIYDKSSFQIWYTRLHHHLC